MYEKHEQELAQLDLDMERLKTLFEQYFMGIEKLPPLTLRDRILRYIRTAEFHRVHNTEIKFRFRTLTQKFASYNSYWERTLRLIEEGSFKRERFKAPNASHPVMQRRLKRLNLEPHADVGAAPPATNGAVTAAQAADGAAAPNGAAAAPRAARVPARPPFEDRLRPLYDEFVAARAANGESVRGLTFDSFRSSVLKTRAAQLARFRCADLDYKVRARDGKVSLVAQPVRDDGGAAPDA
jgi:hypothetical protein